MAWLPITPIPNPEAKDADAGAKDSPFQDKGSLNGHFNEHQNSIFKTCIPQNQTSLTTLQFSQLTTHTDCTRLESNGKNGLGWGGGVGWGDNHVQLHVHTSGMRGEDDGGWGAARWGNNGIQLANTCEWSSRELQAMQRQEVSKLRSPSPALQGNNGSCCLPKGEGCHHTSLKRPSNPPEH